MMTKYNNKVMIISVWADRIYDKRRELIDRLVELNFDVIIAGSEFKKCNHIVYPSEHITSLYLPVSRMNINPFKEFKSLLKIKRIIKKVNPGIILVYGVKIVPSTIIGARLSGVKNIYSYINGAGNLFMQNSAKIKVLRIIAFPMLKLSLMFSKKVIFQNKDDISEFSAKYLVNKKKTCIVNGSGVNMVKYYVSSLPQKITFSFIGRIVAEKGVDDFINASKIVKKQFNDVRFIIAGIIDDNAVNEQKLLKDSVNSGVIEYFGEVKDSNLVLDMSSVFVLPSYREGLPRVNLEAMSKKRAIITTNTVGCRDTVLNDYNGFLVEVKNHKEIAKKMIALIKDRTLIKTMGENGYILCKEKYDVFKVNESLINIICEEENK